VLAVSGADDDAPKLANERYAISKKLGEGGQAATFDAVDKLHGRAVVLKRFRVRGATSWKEVELAEREAHVLASIEHPNLPRYVEHFEERGELWLVTEKIEGESLAAKKQRRAGFRVADVERFLGDARDALAYLHGRAPPIVHRDIKPGNVIARPDGSFAIIDFGSVRDRLKPTGGSTVVGTFGYMAPEQFQGRAMPASDVYAVGVTALVMLTGQEPEELPHKGLAIDVAAALKGLPVRPELVHALEQMTSPDPDARAPRVPELGARAAKKAEPAPRREGRRSEIDHAAAAMADLADELREKRNAL
jgi:serine/threonine protein kinase